MNDSNALALIVAYYISKFDSVAYQRLGEGEVGRTHQRIADCLGVKSNTVRNMRDSFDPLHGHRAGWYQRPTMPSRVRVVEALQDLSEEALYAVVCQVLEDPDLTRLDVKHALVSRIQEEDDEPKQVAAYFPRMVTGAKAEEAFIEEHRRTGIPVTGNLRDVRAMGCGYDFEIQLAEKLFQIEVKGLDDEQGGISFTSKEWEVAGEKRKSYYLIVVRSVSSSPTFQIIRDPVANLCASRYVYTTVQVKWNVTDSELKSTARASSIGSMGNDP